MNLHETEYGRRFFNSQLPSLIKALERIAENLSAPKQSLSADFVADPDFLHDLYYGDYEPSVFKTQSEHQKQLNHNASMAEELLRQKMGNSPEAMAAFEAVSYTHLDVYKRQAQRGRFSATATGV